MRLVLASASPRRAELLRAAGLSFGICAVEIDESPRPDEPASVYVQRLASEKSARAQAVLAAANTRATVGESGGDSPVIIGADTAVVVAGEILGKPRNAADAESMLRRLSGRRHEVMTGVSVRKGVSELSRVETTVVHCTALSDEDVAWYVSSREGLDKAGAYAIQGLASRFMPRIEGSYSNVVGLPVACVFDLLRQLGPS